MNNIGGVLITDCYDSLAEKSILCLLKICDEVVIIESEHLVGNFPAKFEKESKIRKIRSKQPLNFSQMRNLGLKHISTPWVIFLDSDETFSEDLMYSLSSLIENSVDGYWLSRRTYIEANRYLKYGLFYPDYQLRLFKVNQQYLYVGSVHEKVNIPSYKTKEVKLDILHYPRHPKYTKFSDFKNFFPYIRIESDELAKKDGYPLLILLRGLWKGISIFLSAFFRGKGFLDGWVGFRAHILFASYICAIDIVTAYKKVTRHV